MFLKWVLLIDVQSCKKLFVFKWENMQKWTIGHWLKAKEEEEAAKEGY